MHIIRHFPPFSLSLELGKYSEDRLLSSLPLREQRGCFVVLCGFFSSERVSTVLYLISFNINDYNGNCVVRVSSLRLLLLLLLLIFHHSRGVCYIPYSGWVVGTLDDQRYMGM